VQQLDAQAVGVPLLQRRRRAERPADPVAAKGALAVISVVVVSVPSAISVFLRDP